MRVLAQFLLLIRKEHRSWLKPGLCLDGFACQTSICPRSQFFHNLSYIIGTWMVLGTGLCPISLELENWTGPSPTLPDTCQYRTMSISICLPHFYKHDEPLEITWCVCVCVRNESWIKYRKSCHPHRCHVSSRSSKTPSKQLQSVAGSQNDSPNRFEPWIEETRRFINAKHVPKFWTICKFSLNTRPSTWRKLKQCNITNTLKHPEPLICIETIQIISIVTILIENCQKSKPFKAPRPNCSDARPVTSPGMSEAFVSLEARLEGASHSWVTTWLGGLYQTWDSWKVPTKLSVAFGVAGLQWPGRRRRKLLARLAGKAHIYCCLLHAWRVAKFSSKHQALTTCCPSSK